MATGASKNRHILADNLQIPSSCATTHTPNIKLGNHLSLGSIHQTGIQLIRRGGEEEDDRGHQGDCVKKIS